MKEFDLQVTSHMNIKMDSREYLILLYVLDGHYRLSGENDSFDLQEGAIFLLPAGQRFSQQTLREGLLAVFSLSYAALCRNMQTDYLSICCSNLIEQGTKYKKLEQLLQNLLMTNPQDQKHVYQSKSLWYALAALLTEEFQIYEGTSHNDAAHEEERRISYILNYIYANYDQPVILSELADQLYVSTSTLSRFFAKEMGQSFVSYVREFRLHKVVEDLAETNRPIFRIAVDNGFTSPSAMNKAFKTYFGKSPSDYRRQLRHGDRSGNEAPPDDTTLIRRGDADAGWQRDSLRVQAQRMLEINGGGIHSVNGPRQICVNAAQGETEFPRFQTCLNVGAAGCLIQDQIRGHIRILKKELGITQIRIWNLFSDQMMINGKNYVPNFSRLDSCLDFCVENQLDLFFDLSQRTNLAMASEKQTIYQIEDNHLFTSQADWEDFLQNFVRHLLQRYGEQRVSRWVFEITFFLNDRPYYISDRYQSRTVWKRGFEIIKTYLPQAPVAGPGLCGVYDEAFVKNLLDDFLGDGYMPDIFTGFYFPYQATDTTMNYERLADPDYLRKEIGMVNAQLSVHHFTGQHIVTDWTAFMGNRNFLNDSCWRGTYILKNVLDNYAQVDGMGIWFASDLINLYTDSDAPLNGIGGLLTRDGICKPACYAYVFLNRMGRTVVAKGENYLVTKNSRYDLQILCFNHRELGYHSRLIEENAYKPQELHRFFMDQDVVRLSIRIEHLQKETAYVIRQNIINEKEGSVLNEWIELGCERNLTAMETQYLSGKAVPGMRIDHVRSADGVLLLDMQLLPHEMRWISIQAER